MRPQLHVFGHVHAGRGKERVFWDEAQKAFERVAARKISLWSTISISFWLDTLADVTRLLLHDLIGIVWRRVWGAESEGTLMVNSAMVDYFGKPRHWAQTVEI